MTSNSFRTRVSAITCALGLLAAPALAAELPRQALLGMTLEAAPEGRPGAIVQGIVGEYSAAALGVREGDLIVGTGSGPVASPADVISYAREKVAGDLIELTVQRSGSELQLRGTAVARPFESFTGARTEYGAVPFDGGLLRDILVHPEGVESPPVLFLIQGFSCATIESLDQNSPYRQLTQTLVDGGIATYRVEKAGVGDSAVGRQHCTEMDFATELAAFRTAYTHLVEHRGIHPDRIFMFGHSMGGIQGPLLAAERSPRGVAVFGTVLRNWADYHLALHTLQPFLLAARDPAEQMETVERNRDVFRLFYFDRKSPAQIAQERPDLEEALRATIGWDGGERALGGRHYSFLQDQAQQRLGAAWRDTRSNVLSIYGESDVVALFDSDHILIADIVNHYRPGTARYVEVPGTDHGLGLVGDRAELRRITVAQGGAPRGPFNPAVASLVRDWIRESMASPPVRTLPSPPAPVPD